MLINFSIAPRPLVDAPLPAAWNFINLSIISSHLPRRTFKLKNKVFILKNIYLNYWFAPHYFQVNTNSHGDNCIFFNAGIIIEYIIY